MTFVMEIDGKIPWRDDAGVIWRIVSSVVNYSRWLIISMWRVETRLLILLSVGALILLLATIRALLLSKSIILGISRTEIR